MASHRTWPPERIKKALEFWNQGLTQSEIGDKMGVTKNVIAGISRRANFPLRGNPGGHHAHLGPQTERLPEKSRAVRDRDAEARRRMERRAMPPPPPVVIAPPPAPEPAPQPTIDIFKPRASTACCWPIGEPGTKSFRFCDDTAISGKPYCQKHHAIAYVPAKTVGALLMGGPTNPSETAWQALQARAKRQNNPQHQGD